MVDAAMETVSMVKETHSFTQVFSTIIFLWDVPRKTLAITGHKLVSVNSNIAYQDTHAFLAINPNHPVYIMAQYIISQTSIPLPCKTLGSSNASTEKKA
jgi:hypothetical protein